MQRSNRLGWLAGLSLRLLFAVVLGCDSGGSGGGGDGDGGADGDTDGDGDSDGDGDGDSDGDGDGDSDGDIDTDTTKMRPTEFCGESGWCWENPLPQGNALESVWVNGAGDIWFGGQTGTILRHDGEDWYEYRSGVPNDRVSALWGTGPNDMYAAVYSSVLRYDGEHWSVIKSGYGPTDIWGFSQADLWVSGYSGLSHWNGTSWEEHTFTDVRFLAIWGIAPNDVWAVGDAGAAYHWDGTSWTYTATGSDSTLWDVWGSASDDVWAVSPQSANLFHWDGSSWSTIDVGAATGWTGIWGTSADDIWIVSMYQKPRHWDGVFWTEATTDDSLPNVQALHIGPAGETWGVGQHGTVCQWEASVWSCGESATFDTILSIGGSTPEALNAMSYRGLVATRDADGWASATDTWTYVHGNVWQTETGDAWGYYNDRVYDRLVMRRRVGVDWVDMEVGIPTGVIDISIGADGSGWAVGNDGAIYSTEGEGWMLHEQTATDRGLRAVWAAGDNDVWAVGENGTALHYDGVDWTLSSTGSSRDLLAVWGSSGSDVWVCEQYGDLLNFNGVGWVLVAPSTLGDFNDVFGFADNDIWFVDRFGNAVHHDGVDWTEYDTGSISDLSAVWGDAPNDVWAVGRYGDVVHWDGTEWTEHDVGASTSTSLNTVWGVGADDVWVGGEQGSLYYYNGSFWTPMANNLTAQSQTIFDIAGSGTDNIWAALDRSSLHHHNGTNWQAHGFAEPDDAMVHDLWAAASNNIWAVASEGVILHYDGTAWSFVGREFADTLTAIHGASSSAIWAIGSELITYNGTTWTSRATVPQTATETTFIGIYGTDANHIQAMRSDGAVLEWDGTQLITILGASQASFFMDAYWLGLDNMWAVGAAGAILGWDGTTADRPTPLTLNTLRSVWAHSTGDVFVAGDTGTILHRPAE